VVTVSRINARDAYKFVLSSQRPVALLLPDAMAPDFEKQIRAVALSEGAFFYSVSCSDDGHSGKLHVTDSLLKEILEEEVGALSALLLKSAASPQVARNRAFLLLAEDGVRSLSQLKGIFYLLELLEEHEKSSECEPSENLFVRGCKPLKLMYAVKLLAGACRKREHPTLIFVNARESARQLAAVKLPKEARLLLLWPLSSVPRPCELDVIAPRSVLREAWPASRGVPLVKVGADYAAARC